jgi:cilia- and flagella-associated protein 298
MQKQVGHKVALTESMLKDKLQEVKGAVIICYPMGLPQFDPMRMILDGQDGGPAAVRFGHSRYIVAMHI